MELGLKDRVVVITGGATGIGKATALEFLREGAKLAICSRRQSVLDDAKAEFNELGFDIFCKSVDVTDYKAFETFAEEVKQHLGRIDIWVNNAGSNKIKSMMEYAPDEFDSIIKTNLYSVFYGCQIAARHMMPKAKGSYLTQLPLQPWRPTQGVRHTVPLNQVC